MHIIIRTFEIIYVYQFQRVSNTTSPIILNYILVKKDLSENQC